MVASYSDNRTQTCHINSCKSIWKFLRCGVPQGTILGPLLFLLRTLLCKSNESEIREISSFILAKIWHLSSQRNLPCEQRFLSCIAFSVYKIVRVVCLSRSWFAITNQRTGNFTILRLIRVHNDIAIALDQKRSMILLLLDLSAAFDTVDHCILLWLLSSRFGIGGTALEWFWSYLCDRTQFLNTNRLTSERRVLQFGRVGTWPSFILIVHHSTKWYRQ